jgi:peptidylprolyl isomerase
MTPSDSTRTKTTRRRVSLGGAIALSALALMTWTAVAETDYSKIRPSGKERLAILSGLSLPIGKAIEAAEKAGGGRADSAVYVDAVGCYEIMVHGESGTHRMHIDAGSGEVKLDELLSQYPGEAFEGEIRSMEGGLQYVVLREGTGAKPKGPTSRVNVHYSGWLVDGTKFDSSVDRGQPITFGLNQVIKGWTLGVGDMQVGEKRKLIIPYEMAYGANGRGPIPPKALLVFDVELLDIEGE